MTGVYPATSTGRRLALARWIADRENPLTARVAVNHIWMRHFGTPLVPTVFDFGVNGKPPTHPALLDWLAVELMDSGWRMKPIHRLIVTSSAYRMQSHGGGPSDPNLAIDPANHDYWRMNPRRMEAEVVRDNLLRVAGNLDPTLGGPDLDPEIGLTSPRRSLYFRHAKEKRVTFLRLFDSSNVLSCYRRTRERRAPAGAGPGEQPARLRPGAPAGRGDHAAGRPRRRDRHRRRLRRDWRSSACSAASPTPEERAECLRHLAGQAQTPGRPIPAHPVRRTGPAPTSPPAADPAQRARESLVHVLFNHNDFVTIR